MNWFTPQRRLALYNATAGLVAVAIALNAINQATGNEILLLVTQVFDAVAAIGAIAAPLIARLHVTLPKK